MYFSVTERQNAKRCPRMHRLSSKGGAHLGLIVPPVYLGVGSLIHHASQRWLLNPDQSYESHVMECAEAMFQKAHDRYLKQIGAAMGKDEENILYETIYFARIMAQNYQTMWGSPLPEGYVLIRPEQRVVVPVPGTEHPCELCDGKGLLDLANLADPLCRQCDGSGFAYHYLDGRFDGLIQDRAGRIHILEHKTYNSRPNEDALKTNDQFLAYIWLALQLGIGDVAGLAYDGLWRRDKVPKGRTFEDLFIRVTVTRTLNELREFERMLPNELNMMAVQLQAPTDPWINRRWQGCYDCSFNTKKLESGRYRTGLCNAMSRGEDVEAVKNLHYTERDDDLEGDDIEFLEPANA